MTREPRISVTRRKFLRQTSGAALALPWLDSLPARSDETGKTTSSVGPANPPLRFACLCFADGVEPAHWWAKGAGAEMEIGEGLKPMQPFREEMIFLKGLYNELAEAHDSAHLGRFPNVLSGAWVSTKQRDIRVGQTMDQLLAQRLAGQTKIPSLVLGIEPTELRLEDGVTMLYGSCISWATDTKPAAKEIYPSRVFDLLVGARQGRQLDQSILDEVRADANSVNAQIDLADRHKLDEYLTSIRDIEKRIQFASRQRHLEGWQPTLIEPNLARPPEGLPHDVPTHMKLMMDLIVLAFQMDKTRIATCLLNNDLSAMTFEFLDDVRGTLHADLTHNGGNPEVEIMHMKTNQFHVQQFAYLVNRLKNIDEGGTSILDNSMLLCCSNMFDGDAHQAEHMPMLLAGRGGGGLQTGRVLDYLDQGDDHRRACSLYLSLMDRMGVHVPRFGDTSERLAGL